MFSYIEGKGSGNEQREQYLASISEQITVRRSTCDSEREKFAEFIKSNPQKARQMLVEMLGWPLTEYKFDVVRCKKEQIFSENEISAFRMQFDILDKIKFYGIYFEQTQGGKHPLVIAQHGGLGSPELCSGIWGSSENYNDMTKRILKQGVNVFAPQLMLWDMKDKNADIDTVRRDLDAQLKQIGSSIAALEIYCIMKCIDYLSVQKNVDENKIGMAGLSYGGFYTLFTTAIDTRIKAAVSDCFFNDRYKYSWSDWTWFGSGVRFLDSEAAMLIYPRHLSIQVGDKDEVFAVEGACAEYERLKRYSKDEQWFDFSTFDGTHEFYKTDEYIEKMVDKLNK